MRPDTRCHWPLVPANSRGNRRLALCVLLAALTLVISWWAQRGIPQLANLGSQQALTLPCVSYSPFRYPDINPFNYTASVTREQIETDLARLKSLTTCVRTYGLAQGLDQVPAVARQLGLRVKLGLWIARDAQHNQNEISRGMALATQYADVVDLVIVGNEVLLRKELTAAQLGDLLRQAKALSPRPISYADVWEFWQRNDSLAAFVDQVTVHVLPYWEDNPVAVDEALAHVARTAQAMQTHFAPKPVWVGETGWPAQGRQRAGALPSVLGQTQFIRQLAGAKAQMPVAFNVIEAYDQPWKRSFEGAMGGYWGLFDQHGNPRVTTWGAVVEDARWWRGPVGAVVGLLLGFALARVAQSPRLPLAICTALLGALAPLQWQASVLWDRTTQEASVSLALAVLGGLCAWLSVWQSDRAASPSLRLALPGGRRSFSVSTARLAQGLRLVVLFFASCAALVLLLDPRYRPFPWWWFVAPATAWWVLRWLAPERLQLHSAQAKLLAWALLVGALGIAVQEGWHNTQALGYSALLLAIAGAVLWPARSGPCRADSPAKTKAANNAAGAHSSVE